MQACKPDDGECQAADQLDDVRARPAVPCGKADIGPANHSEQERTSLLSQRLREQDKHRNRGRAQQQAGPVWMRGQEIGLRLNSDRLKAHGRTLLFGFKEKDNCVLLLA
jgi:hypothetical protein